MKYGSVSVSRGPFLASQLRPGDRYELSAGHPRYAMPTGGRGANAVSVGDSVLRSDPAVASVGVDAGFSPAPDLLRAPDLAVGSIPDEPGWIAGVPALAVEYADTGQDESDLATKIQELLAAGTRIVWVVRLTGPRRVEIHTPQGMQLAHPGETLTAPGILQNPVPVEALYDPASGEAVTLRNLLQRRGYESLDAVRAEAFREAILTLLAGRGLGVGEAERATLAACVDPLRLKQWLERAVTADSAAAVFS